jgi:peptidoglycan/xylan/chitin deacetylase (PgdA/CDA1 family)
MQEEGVTFGSHSYSHHDLTTLGEKECERDLRESRELLEDLLGRPVAFLAYPFGHHDRKVRRAAERAGFSHAFSLPEGREPTGRYAVPRVVVVPGNGAISLRIKASTWYLDVRAHPVFPVLRGVARRTGLGFRASA